MSAAASTGGMERDLLWEVWRGVQARSCRRALTLTLLGPLVPKDGVDSCVDETWGQVYAGGMLCFKRAASARNSGADLGRSSFAKNRYESVAAAEVGGRQGSQDPVLLIVFFVISPPAGEVFVDCGRACCRIASLGGSTGGGFCAVLFRFMLFCVKRQMRRPHECFHTNVL